MSFVIQSQCAYSGQPIRIEIDSDLNLRHVDEGANPYIFVPSVNLDKTKEDSIIDIF